MLRGGERGSPERGIDQVGHIVEFDKPETANNKSPGIPGH
jgi:hypothetical protein